MTPFKPERIWIAFAALSGACATAADVGARHLLSASPVRADFALTGARFGFVHALALLGVAILSLRLGGQHRIWLVLSGWSFLIGQLFFSVSLYLIAANMAFWTGRLTVPGLVVLVIGWLALFVHAIAHSHAD